MRRFRPAVVMLLAGWAALLVLAWWWPNRLQAGDVGMPAARFNSISFESYRTHESPLTRSFPTAAEVDSDMALVARRSRAIRTYAAKEGDYDLPALARAHGLKMWQGIWLGGDRAANAREMAAGIAAARKYPDVIERVVVGNEVLLRKDLPVAELIADIDAVKRAVAQPVTYADVWNFFLANPQIVPHLDVVTIHILPYWEDTPTNTAGAIAYAHRVVMQFKQMFPGRKVAIGEIGWPSRGRWRQDAVPSLVNQMVFLRRFMALAAADRFDYNFIEAFNQVWKYQNEGVVGASWGLWTADRVEKFPQTGAVHENANWPLAAGFSVLCGLLLYGIGTAGAAAPRPPVLLASVAMVLGGALGFAWAGTAPVLFDRGVVIAALGNLAGQAALALLFVRRLAGLAAPARTGADATLTVRMLLQLRLPANLTNAAFDDLAFVFVWAACVLQLLLLYDGRYRDFPIPTFAVPVAIVAVRAVIGDLVWGGGGREEWVLGVTLAAAALGGAWFEGPLNHQSLRWATCALILAGSVLVRVARPKPRVRSPAFPN